MRCFKYVFLLVICCLGGGFFVATFWLPPHSAGLPRAAALVVVVVGLTDLLMTVRKDEYFRGPMVTEKHSPEQSAEFRQKLILVLWLGATVLSIYMFGFIWGVLVSSTTFFQVFVWKQLWRSAIAALLVTAGVYMSFVWLAGFNLYGGALFG